MTDGYHSKELMAEPLMAEPPMAEPLVAEPLTAEPLMADDDGVLSKEELEVKPQRGITFLIAKLASEALWLYFGNFDGDENDPAGSAHLQLAKKYKIECKSIVAAGAVHFSEKSGKARWSSGLANLGQSDKTRINFHLGRHAAKEFRDLERMPGPWDTKQDLNQLILGGLLHALTMEGKKEGSFELCVSDLMKTELELVLSQARKQLNEVLECKMKDRRMQLLQEPHVVRDVKMHNTSINRWKAFSVPTSSTTAMGSSGASSGSPESLTNEAPLSPLKADILFVWAESTPLRQRLSTKDDVAKLCQRYFLQEETWQSLTIREEFVTAFTQLASYVKQSEPSVVHIEAAHGDMTVNWRDPTSSDDSSTELIDSIAKFLFGPRDKRHRGCFFNAIVTKEGVERVCKEHDNLHMVTWYQRPSEEQRKGLAEMFYLHLDCVQLRSDFCEAFYEVAEFVQNLFPGTIVSKRDLERRENHAKQMRDLELQESKERPRHVKFSIQSAPGREEEAHNVVQQSLMSLDAMDSDWGAFQGLSLTAASQTEVEAKVETEPPIEVPDDATPDEIARTEYNFSKVANSDVNLRGPGCIYVRMEASAFKKLLDRVSCPSPVYLSIPPRWGPVSELKIRKIQPGMTCWIDRVVPANYVEELCSFFESELTRWAVKADAEAAARLKAEAEERLKAEEKARLKAEEEEEAETKNLFCIVPSENDVDQKIGRAVAIFGSADNFTVTDRQSSTLTFSWSTRSNTARFTEPLSDAQFPLFVKLEVSPEGAEEGCLEKIEKDLETWHKDAKAQNEIEPIDDEENKFCKKALMQRNAAERSKACQALGKLGFQDGPLLSKDMLRAKSIYTLYSVVQDGQEEAEVKATACDALLKLAAHRCPSTTTKVLEQAAETASYKVVDAAGIAIDGMKEVREAEEKSGCNRCYQCMHKNILQAIQASEISIKERNQQCEAAEKYHEELKAQHIELEDRNNSIRNEMDERIRQANAEKQSKIKEANKLRDDVATQNKVLSKVKEDRRTELRNERIQARRDKNPLNTAKVDKLTEDLRSYGIPKDVDKIVRDCSYLKVFIEQRTDAIIELINKLAEAESFKVTQAAGAAKALLEEANEKEWDKVRQDVEDEFKEQARKQDALKKESKALDEEVKAKEKIAKDAEAERANKQQELDTAELGMKKQIDAQWQDVTKQRSKIKGLEEEHRWLEELSMSLIR